MSRESRSVVSDSLRPHGLHSPWNSPGQNTGVDSHSLLQGIFPTQGLNQPGSPRILDWVAYPFSSRSSQPRNRTEVSCILYQLQILCQLSYQGIRDVGSIAGSGRSPWTEEPGGLQSMESDTSEATKYVHTSYILYLIYSSMYVSTLISQFIPLHSLTP